MISRPLSDGNKGLYELPKLKQNQSIRIRMSAWEKEDQFCGILNNPEFSLRLNDFFYLMTYLNDFVSLIIKRC